jgi:LPPG:FO 2-phospho-L-lactate transferase
MKVVGLGGGIGASRLWRALAPALDPGEVTLVVNTADDIWMHGLRICPDLDTTLYALSGRQDRARGWGLLDESFRTMDALRGLGRDIWFNLGDLDLATHLFRTELLRDGYGLTEITARLATAMGLATRVLPMSEDEVTTTVVTAAHGPLHYEEWLVRYGAEPAVATVDRVGLDKATPAPGVLEAIAAADVVVLAPSNPVASIAPILGVAGVRDAIQVSPATVVAVSPIVAGVAITDPGEARRAASREVLLRSQRVDPTPVAVAGLYTDLLDRFVLDTADAVLADEVARSGVDVVVVPTLLHTGAPADRLLDALFQLP